MLRLAIPVLNVASSEAAEKFYCGQLGFQRQFAYRIDESNADPCYMGFKRDEAWIHVSSFSGDGVAGTAVYLVVDDVDQVYATMVKNGYHADLEPTDQSWGNREMYVEDPDGNSIRFVQEKKIDQGV